MPETADGALLAAGLAALGYVGKMLLQEWSDYRTRRAQRLASLLELNALLRAAGTAFREQRRLAGELAIKLFTNHPDEAKSQDGLEDLFASLHDTFTPDEVDDHRVIRSYSEHALRPMNKAVSAWLRADKDFRVYVSPRPRRRPRADGTGADNVKPGVVEWVVPALARRRVRLANEVEQRAGLAKSLADLEAHLLLWHAMYAGWLVDQPAHALVYLADEKKRGIGFPHEVEGAVLAVVEAELRRSFTRPAPPTPAVPAAPPVPPPTT